LLSGQYFDAPETGRHDGNPVYMKNVKKGKYTIKDDRKGIVSIYDERFTTIFPRMWSDQKPAHIALYKEYGKIKGKPISIAKGDGTSEVIYKPTFGENLRFFFSYQVNHMYLRYFMWNFAGRQNHMES